MAVPTIGNDQVRELVYKRGFASINRQRIPITDNKVISDQYQFEVITKKDGSSVWGRVVNEKDDILIIATNPYDFTQTTEVPRSEVKDIKPSPVSPMPPNLINSLNEQELRDLLGYLLKK